MAKDDCFVIVYRFLAYLYDCLKKGEAVNTSFDYHTQYGIQREYWQYIVSNLLDEGYLVNNPVAITPRGIKWLFKSKLAKEAASLFQS